LVLFNSFTILLVFVLGLAFGSFLSVVTWRIPRKASFNKGRSHCPTCGAMISWYDNIPLVSFICLRGKCRSCQKSISIRYPLIELSTGLSFVGLWFLLSFCKDSTEAYCLWRGALGTLSLPFLYFVLLITLSIFVIDIEQKLIPDELIFVGFVTTASLIILAGTIPLYLHLFSAFVVALFLLAINLMTHGGGMGLGDVKYALLGGLFLGWPVAAIWLFVAFLTGGALAIILILIRKAGRKDQIAFGPFLAFSFFVSAVWGQALFQLLLR